MLRDQARPHLPAFGAQATATAAGLPRDAPGIRASMIQAPGKPR